jgi:curli production assembly/transport component CsgF
VSFDFSVQAQRLALAGIVFAAMVAPASAGTLIYTPTNPSFGGNPLNGSTLLSTAQAQNQHLPSTNSPGSTPLTPGQVFAQQLQSQLYASLANQITQQIFGASAQPNGTFSFGGTTITYSPTTDANGNPEIEIKINDGSTVTVIDIPKPPGSTTGTGTN